MFQDLPAWGSSVNYALEAITSMLQLGTSGFYQHRHSYTSIDLVNFIFPHLIFFFWGGGGVLQSTATESVYHNQGTIEPNLWEFSCSLGVKLAMTVSHSVYHRVLSTCVQSISSCSLLQLIMYIYHTWGTGSLAGQGSTMLKMPG